MISPSTTPKRLDLKKDAKLDIEWQDGTQSTYTLTLLRSMCPCATCKMVREQRDPHDISPQPAVQKKPLLTILPGNYVGQIVVKNAEMVGNYAIKLEWSDGHDSGIYSFQYLREIGTPRNS